MLNIHAGFGLKREGMWGAKGNRNGKTIHMEEYNKSYLLCHLIPSNEFCVAHVITA